MDYSQIEELFREIFILNSLEQHHRAELARSVGFLEFKTGDRFLTQGEMGEHFFIIFEGQVSASHSQGNIDTQINVFVPGDFFGEESLLFERPSDETVTAITDGTLLYLDKALFEFLMDAHPQVKTGLVRTVRSRRFARTHKFDWLREEEVIYQVRRKHPAYLLAAMIGPLVLMIITLSLAILGIFMGPDSSFFMVSLIVSAILFVVTVVWILWTWVDWTNDYYIVTSERVIWIERVVFLYESRIEAPLDTILSVNVNSSYIGRILGYGNVIVRTFTGQVPLRSVGEPGIMGALIEEYWHRAKLGIQREEEKEIERSVRKILGHELEEDEQAEQQNQAHTPQQDSSLPEYTEPGFREKYLGNIFSVRVEEGNTITFRKHWVLLLRKTWLPTLMVIFLLLVLLIYDGMYITGNTSIGSPLIVQVLAILILLLILLPWWLYNYIDWRNDIYQVTDKSIFDIERKPFGREVRKSAPLDNILSLEHERPGLLGYLLNYGNVTINVGEAKFIFRGVFEPARVQQDIFDRMYYMRQQREKREVERERERILALLDSYHRNVEEPPLQID